MKLRFLASLSVLLAFGCSQSPAPAPVSEDVPDVEISIPDIPSESDGAATDSPAAANETLVSLSIPDMH